MCYHLLEYIKGGTIYYNTLNVLPFLEYIN